MRVTVTPKGPTLDTLTRDTIRDLRAANRRAGRQVAKTGGAAMRKGAPRKLGVKDEVESWPDRWSVEWFPAPRTSGAWAIAESGARPHTIDPRRRRALAFAGRYAANVNHPGTAGRQAWTKAGARLADVLDRDIIDIYDEVLT